MSKRPKGSARAAARTYNKVMLANSSKRAQANGISNAVLAEWKRIAAIPDWTEQQRVIAAMFALSDGLVASHDPQNSVMANSLGHEMRELLIEFGRFEQIVRQAGKDATDEQMDQRDAAYGVICMLFLDTWAKFVGSPRLEQVMLPQTDIVVRRQHDPMVRAFTRLGRLWQDLTTSTPTSGNVSYEHQVWACASAFATVMLREFPDNPQLYKLATELAIVCVNWDQAPEAARGVLIGQISNLFLDTWSVANGLRPGGMEDLKLSGTNIVVRRDHVASEFDLPDRVKIKDKTYVRPDTYVRPGASDYHKRVLADEQTTWDDFKRWCDSFPFRLQKNDCSRVHGLNEAIRKYQCYLLSNTPDGDLQLVQCDNTMEKIIGQHEVMVVRHDWGRALGPAVKEAEGSGGSIQPPFPNMLYEFRINDRTVIAMVSVVGPGEYSPLSGLGQSVSVVRLQGDSDDIIVSVFYQAANGHWIAAAPNDALLDFLNTQVEAICVALDAEVATKEVVRAPSALNAKREKKGNPPLRDYHVVDLSKRSRIGTPPPAQPFDPNAPKRRSPRLHFRRGHWRHYATHKTRIKWQLVGNPDLGFIEKEYRL